MADWLWLALMAVLAIGAVREGQNVWFLYQVRKRRAPVRRGLRLVVSNRKGVA